MIRRHLTPSLIISLLALFIATSTASYAALKIPKNSVGTKQLKTSSVTSKKVKDGTLQAKDLKPGTIPTIPPATTIDAYRFERPSGLLALGNTPAAIFSTGTLPAGSYVLTARTNIAAANDAKIICSIANDAAQNITIDTNKVIALSQTATVTLTEAGTVDLNCWKNASPSATVQVAQTTITAIKVTSVTTG